MAGVGIEITDEALERITRAFWDQVAKEFPTATGGSFSSEGQSAFDDAVEQAVHEWVYWNVPSPE